MRSLKIIAPLLVLPLLVLGYAPVIKAAEPYFVVEEFLFKDVSSADVKLNKGGRIYAKSNPIRVEFVGYYVVPGGFWGSPIDAGCFLKHQGSNINIEVTHRRTTTYDSHNAVYLECGNSDTITLQEGKNTLQMGGSVVFQGTGIIPGPVKYDSPVDVYYDSTKPVVDISLVKAPSNCTVSRLNSGDPACDITVKYKVSDPNDGLLETAQISFKSGSNPWTDVGIPGPYYDGNWHEYTVDARNTGVTTEGSHTVIFKVSAVDQVGNSSAKELAVGITVAKDPVVTTPVPTVSPTVTSTQTPEPTLTVTTMLTDSPTPTATEAQYNRDEDVKKGYAGIPVIAYVGIGLGVALNIVAGLLWRKYKSAANLATEPTSQPEGTHTPVEEQGDNGA